jgi:predicted dehydrogenase
MEAKRNTRSENSRTLARREFLRGAVGAMALPMAFRTGIAAGSPGGKLNHASIGVGGMMGGNDLQNFVSHPSVKVVALCDVDSRNLEKARQVVPDARVYSDWREMLDKEQDRIDSVNVTVPDHMHFPIATKALRLGKHVYCQKPLCHDVAEVRALTAEARRAGVVTQLGTHISSSIGERTALEYLRRGVIGKVRSVVLCANRPGAIENYRLPGPRPAQGETPPAELNWDLWIGNAPMRPYVPRIYHPSLWRAWQDFGTGWSGDIGCHLFDLPWKGLSLGTPLAVRASVQESWRDSPQRRADTWPQSNHITWRFPGTPATEGNELTVDWYDGLFYPPKEIQSLYPGETYPTESSLFIGTEGALLYPLDSGPWLLPRDKFKDVERPKLEARNHYHHFADACLGRGRTECDFLQTGPMTEAILLGTVAVRWPDRWLDWDAAGMKIPHCADAESNLRRSYRQGWAVA